MGRINKQTMAQLAGGDTGLPEWTNDLTPEELRFVSDYLIDFNCRAAAIRVKLSDKGGDACASKARDIMRREHVRRAIAKATAEDADQRLKTRQKVLEELSAIAFYDVTDHVQMRKNTVEFTDTSDLTSIQMKAVKRYKQTTGKNESIEVEFHDKVKALELIAKMNGDIQQGGSGVTINNNNGIQNDKVLVLTPDEARVALQRKPGERPAPVTAPVVFESPVPDGD